MAEMEETGGRTETARTRVAIVGAGFIADHHVQALRELPWLDVVAVCDASVVRAEALRRRYGIASATTDLGALLAESRPHVAHVLTPPPTHADLATTLLEAGVHVLVEKPLAPTSAECRHVDEQAQAHRLVAGVNHNLCFHPAYRQIQACVAAGDIGPVQHVAATLNVPLRQLAQRQLGHWMFEAPENLLLELGCHPLSAICGLVGAVREASTQAPAPIDLYGERRIFPVWQSSLVCERGTASLFLAAGREFLASRLLVIGPDGTLEADLASGAVTRQDKTRWPEFWEVRRNDGRNARRLRQNARRAFWGYTLSTLKLRPRNDLFYAMLRDSVHAFHGALRERQPLPWANASGRTVVEACERVLAGWQRPRARPARETAASHPPASGAPVLVTGATGFLGGHVVERLREQGRSVRAFVRSDGWLPPWLRLPGVEVVVGSLASTRHLEQAVAGTAAVVHLATGVSDDWEATQRDAIEATRALAAQAREAAVARFVFTSSIAALYVGDLAVADRVGADLDVDPKPQGRSLYARAKIACETLLRDERSRGLPVVVLRPGLVLGPRGRTRHSGVGYWPKDNHCLGWGSGEHPLPFVLVQDVAAAIVAALDRDAAVGQSLNLAGEVRLSARDYVAALAARSGRRIEFHPQSLWAVQALDVGKWLVKLAIRKPGNAFPSFRDLTTRALQPWFDCQAAREALGWRPETSRERFLELGIGVPVAEGG